MKIIIIIVTLILFTGPVSGQNCEANVEYLLANIDELIYNDSTREDALVELESLLNECLADKDSFDIFLGGLYHKLGYASYWNDKETKAVNYFTLAIKIKSEERYYSESTANSFYLRAESNYYLDNYTKAIQDVETAISIIEKINYPKKDSLFAMYYESLAKNFKSQGDFYNAKQYLDKASNTVLSLKGEYQKMIYYVDRAQVLNKLKNNSLAQKDYEKAKKIWEDGSGKYPLSSYNTIINDLGLIYLDEGQFDKAISSFNKALSIYIDSPSPDTAEMINLQANLLNAYSQKNQLYKADSIFNTGVDLAKHFYKNIPYQPVMSELYYLKAIVERKKGSYQSALESHQTSIAILVPSFTPKASNQSPILDYQPTGEKNRLRTALTHKAKTYQQKFQVEEKQADLEAALNTYFTLDTLITQMRKSFNSVDSKYFLQQESVPIYDEAIQVALKLNDLTGDPSYQEIAHQFLARNKAIILIESLQDKTLKSKNIDPILLAKDKSLTDKYNNLETLIYDATQNQETILAFQLKDSLFATKRAHESLQNQIKEAYPGYYQHKLNYHPNINITEIQDKLEPNRAVIEFFIGEQFIYTSTITKETLHVQQIPKPENFKIKCDSFINMTRGDYMIEARFSKIAFEIYNTLFSPSSPYLDGISRLIVVPDDFLLRVPFSALLTEAYSITGNTWGDKQIPYLIKKYALSQVYASSLLLDKKTQQKIAAKSYLGLGIKSWDYINPDSTIYADSLSQRIKGRLKYSEEEVQSVSELFEEGDVIVGRKATRKFVEDEAGKYEILHFSTHGVSYEDAPLNSTLVLSKLTTGMDNLLKVADIYALDLSATKMVVLSACQTLSGRLNRGEGMRTLSRAFSYAGSPSLVASFWNINDFSSKDIMIDFFKELKTGQPKDIALQQAQLNYLETQTSGNWALPQYWAQTIVIGNTDALFRSSRWAYGLAVGGLLLFCFLFFRKSSKKDTTKNRVKIYPKEKLQ